MEEVQPELKFLHLALGPGFTFGITTEMEVVAWGLVGRLADGRKERLDLYLTSNNSSLSPCPSEISWKRSQVGCARLCVSCKMAQLFLPADDDIEEEDSIEEVAKPVPLFRGRRCVMLAVGPTHGMAVIEDQT